MTEEYTGAERRKSEQQNHDMLIQHGADIIYIKETVSALKNSVDNMAKTLIQDRKECWETCNGQLKIIDATAQEAKSSIKAIRAVGSVVAFGLTLLAGWAKIGGGK